MQPGLNRRDVLALAGASTLAGCVHEPRPEPLPVKVQRFVDAHCHIFNAADVPAAGFVVHVAAREMEFEEYKYLIAFFVALLASGAPTPQAEMDKLGGRNFLNLAPQPSLSDEEFESKILGALNTLAAGGTVDTTPEGLSQAPALPDEPAVQLLKRHRIPVDPQDFRVGGRRANAKAVALDYLLRKYAPGAEPEATASSGPAAPRDTHVFQPLQNTPALATLARSLAGKARGGDALDLFERFLILARIFLDYRSANLRKLDRLFGAQSGAPARLYCPATIDYDEWIVSPDAPGGSAPLPEQAAVMARIALDPRTDVLLNGYIAFDPLRAVLHKKGLIRGPRPLDVVMQALSASGCVGVKLYPPMGFRPWNNAAVKDGFGPVAARADPTLRGEELDDALRELYDYCIQADVPILAHCSNSQSSFEGAGERAAPQYWEQLLSLPQYNRLRLNLGHFGSLWCHDNNKQRNADEAARCQVADSWPAYILRLLTPDASGNLRFPNLYFDIADVGDFTDKTYRDQLLAYLKSNLPSDPVARAKTLSHMLYGTDWMFLAMDPNMRRFAVALEEICSDPGLGITVDDVLGRNTLRFLGLTQGAQTANRLRAFYKDDVKHLPMLDQLILPA